MMISLAFIGYVHTDAATGIQLTSTTLGGVLERCRMHWMQMYFLSVGDVLAGIADQHQLVNRDLGNRCNVTFGVTSAQVTAQQAEHNYQREVISNTQDPLFGSMMLSEGNEGEGGPDSVLKLRWSHVTRPNGLIPHPPNVNLPPTPPMAPVGSGAGLPHELHENAFYESVNGSGPLTHLDQ